ncbi:MAG: triose-phosphate isomerase, partial [Gemmatimonadetes bacterium]|nr:triose-phosphate isomerase [Gemmatimonadota bacterium]
MKRRSLVAGNWKMHNTGPDAAALAADLRRRIEAFCDFRDVVVCPPSTSLTAVREALKESAISLGAQNMHWEEAGAFTGEVSAPMLLTSGCTHVIIGHSERRQLFGDTDAAVNRKLGAALHSGLTPLVCIGETLAEREAGRTEAVVLGQLRAAVKEIP